jgi:hypothetical protein
MAKSLNVLRWSVLSSLLALIVVVLAGCGGGGGGNNDSGGMNLFVTDDLNTNYDQVWVTIYDVEVRDAGTGNYKTVFTSNEGVTVNLRGLNDGNERFFYLGNDQVPDGSYAGARVTMDRNLTVVATGTTFGEACVFDPSVDFGPDRSRVAFDFGAPISVSGNESLVVDFDLANWTKAGALVTPVVVQGDDSTLADMGRHESGIYRGTVRSVSGASGSQTFRLERSGGDIDVQTDASTVVYNESSAGSPSISNGEEVEVEGAFSVTTNRLNATLVRVEDGQADGDLAVGATSNLNLLANTVDVYAREVRGFLPINASIKVAFDTNTQFFANSGAPITLAQATAELATGVEIEAEGDYSSVTDTLTAAKIKIHDETENEVEATGSMSNINGIGGTFDLSLSSWFGFSGSNGGLVHVTTGVGTTFYDDDEQEMTSVEFFAAVNSGTVVEVEGRYAGASIEATKVSIEDTVGGQAEAKGYVSTFSEGTGTITVELVEWSGFTGGFGNNLVIQTTGATSFEDADGNTLTSNEFFAALGVDTVIDARGSFSTNVLTASRVRLRD